MVVGQFPNIADDEYFKLTMVYLEISWLSIVKGSSDISIGNKVTSADAQFGTANNECAGHLLVLTNALLRMELF